MNQSDSTCAVISLFLKNTGYELAQYVVNFKSLYSLIVLTVRIVTGMY